ncbi:LYSC6 family protein [Megaselia abdita]
MIVMKRLLLLFADFYLILYVNGKIYNACDLASILHYQLNLQMEEVANWVCIAKFSSNLNSSAFSFNGHSNMHGLFQISEKFCSNSFECNEHCDKYLDDEIIDDFACNKKIFAKNKKTYGNGYQSWPAFNIFCDNGRSVIYIKDCENNLHVSYDPRYIDHTPIHQTPKKGKVYSKCELAKELRDKYHFPIEEISTWVCIAYHESRLDTSAVGRFNPDGSADHGLFQISDLWWCSPSENSKGCKTSCDKFEDNDISDDIACVRTIKSEHDRLFGNGFTAWTVYNIHCAGNTDHYLSGCSNFSSQLQHNPFLISKSKHSKTKVKIYSKCELADELYNRHNFPLEEIAIWVCIAYHESRLDTSSVGRLNADGSGDHGIFQISDLWWCSPQEKGKGCNASCDQFEDSDITDDVACVRTIKKEHDKLFGNGFTAWTVYNDHCSNNVDYYLTGCSIHGSSRSVHNQIDQSPHKGQKEKINQKGKVYDKCELATELLVKYNIPKEDISTWVCIAKHESEFNTAAVGRLNADGSADHGLFQISDLFWCSSSGKGKGCGRSCNFYEDSDISDDVECIKLIKSEHDRYSGNGFSAWTVYNLHCSGNTDYYIKGCFGNNLDHHQYATSKYNTTSSYNVFSNFIDKSFVVTPSKTVATFDVFKSFIDRPTSYKQSPTIFQAANQQTFSIFKEFVDKSSNYTPQASENMFSVFKKNIDKPGKYNNQISTTPKNEDTNILKFTIPMPSTTTKKYVTISRSTSSKPTQTSFLKTTTYLNANSETTKNLPILKKPLITKAPNKLIYNSNFTTTIKADTLRIQNFSPHSTTAKHRSPVIKNLEKSYITTKRSSQSNSWSSKATSKTEITTQIYSKTTTKPIYLYKTTTKKPHNQNIGKKFSNVVEITTRNPFTNKILIDNSRSSFLNTAKTESTTATNYWRVKNDSPTKIPYRTSTTNNISTNNKESKSSLVILTSQHSNFPDKSKSEKQANSSNKMSSNIFELYLKNYKI